QGWRDASGIDGCDHAVPVGVEHEGGRNVDWLVKVHRDLEVLLVAQQLHANQNAFEGLLKIGAMHVLADLERRESAVGQARASRMPIAKAVPSRDSLKGLCMAHGFASAGTLNAQGLGFGFQGLDRLGIEGKRHNGSLICMRRLRTWELALP